MSRLGEFEVAAYNRMNSREAREKGCLPYVLLHFFEINEAGVVAGDVVEALIERVEDEALYQRPEIKGKTTFERLQELIKEALILESVVLEPATEEQGSILTRGK